MLQKTIAALFVFLLLPFFLIFIAVMYVMGYRPLFFIQKRMGKDMKEFDMYKIRTMVPDAEKKKNELIHENEADGPVFKIRNDPRYTKIGKFLSHTGIDELPQLINIMRGEMALVGPRPLPVGEARKIPLKYHNRFSVLPGITSLWVVRGAHNLTFKEWMELDLWYVKNKSWRHDLGIGALTVYLLLHLIIRKIISVLS